MIPALTMGEPAGVGPELIAAAWKAGVGPFTCLGAPDVLRRFDVPVVEVAEFADGAKAWEHGVPVLGKGLPEPVTPGTPNLANAPATLDWIAQGIDLAMSGAASALVTAPISKKVLQDGAAFSHPGHTEFLAHQSGAARPVMMLAGTALKVVPVTIHIALADVPTALTADLLKETIRVTDAGLKRDFGIAAPRIAVAGLNPHAGEGGAMGQEEIELIKPALVELDAEGLQVTGPLPADTMFHPAARAQYDVAVCMYHDQALVPLKTLSFSDGVNVTLGLPFVRTSPDHGTAFDIAGRGIADPESLFAAIRMAGDLADRRSAV
ncbi:4-hydroxythreonine-4-phosphate dehydrogenase PdxA [Pontivivens insulae]|uniref:4-hydroxythreonine-4-phosphate dehydrogenase n=1 Tax=Pontivivens insulae TaxID=1639689 RepID=A0A2R8ABD3_9RHOB|nr:4-hydroxythreonine-4-phosphate dehydrogenase PdxA [Pontivivens insulae]RED13303.1 4-hydroxythreonine-4-phosphate dehydrogenase [Pontivivens insulae]SPF29395.1 4-hydroxythreonine-4-phosphate dehydrogenase [Pontivivens insulae]